MLTKLRLSCSGRKDKVHNYHLSSVTHGVLMEYMDRDYAEVLHESRMKPYSQSVLFGKQGAFVWEINMLGEEARFYITRAIQNMQGEFCFRKREERVEIKEIEEEYLSLEDLENIYRSPKPHKMLKLYFQTPTSFKQKERYALFPTPRLLFQNLLNRYHLIFAEGKDFDPRLLEDFESYVQIEAYRLQTARFSLERSSVPAFMGELSIKIEASDELAAIANLLLAFGRYAGVGIKTALGMGSLELNE